MVNKAKKIYGDIKDILEGFNKKKIKSQRIPNLSLFQKAEGHIPIAIISSKNIDNPIEIKNEYWPSVKKVFLIAILVILATCLSKKIITIKNNTKDSKKLIKIIIEENRANTLILNENCE
ncbi:37701_t:CDS:2 [Gigaspora margarita]|uniref:37701_t:CDS:1 n=1 Tax=Gigaspora margarita TaxID=4874 RepID=A0ABN7VIN2_GIGMA|nr:37701_t:CDS:2 [Gigaspora margarita]